MRNVVSFLAVAAWVGAQGGCSESEAPASKKKSGPPPALVELGDVGPGNLTDGWAFLGQVQPALSAEIAAAVAGHVRDIKVREGDEVAAKALLVTIDASDASAKAAAARAKLAGIKTELELARRQLQRIAGLDYPTVSEPEKEKFELQVKTLEAQLAVQRAEVRRIQVELAHHFVKAPFAGTVKARHVDPGAWVAIGKPLVEIVSVANVEVHVDVPAELGSRLKVGDTAELLGQSTATVRIAGIVPALDPSTRSMRIRLVADERPDWLIAGMAIDVRFKVELSGSGVTVSPDALVRGAVDVRVIKFVDGSGVPVKVQVVAQTKKLALVRGDGLAVGDKVVVRGNERLRPGQPLRVKPSGAAPAPPIEAKKE